MAETQVSNFKEAKQEQLSLYNLSVIRMNSLFEDKFWKTEVMLIYKLWFINSTRKKMKTSLWFFFSYNLSNFPLLFNIPQWPIDVTVFVFKYFCFIYFHILCNALPNFDLN